MADAPQLPVDTVAVVGIGLMGGSFARDIRARGFARTVIGTSRTPASAARALELGLVDRILPLEDAVRAARLIVVGVPVDTTVRLLPRILDQVDDRQTVTDVGSTKQTVMEAVRCHPNRRRFVGGHPMAGTEYSGPDAALSGLFDGKVGIVCDVADSAPDAVALVETLYRTLGMRIERCDAARHDMHVAYVSHVSHAISYALALTVLAKARDERQIFDLAGGGFSSTARLAKSSADMWTPIFLHNRENILAVLETYFAKLEALRDAIARRDEPTLRTLLQTANDIRRVLS